MNSRTPAIPAGLEPYGVNMVVQRLPLLEMGGFADRLGRFAGLLLSDEDVQVGWKLQDRGHSAWYDSRIVVRHQIQGTRMNPEWLIKRLYWQGASTVATRRMLGQPEQVWREFPRRLAVEMLTAFAGLVPKDSTRLLPLRWRLAYAQGFTRMALANEQKKRSLPGRVLRALIRRDGTPIIPALDIGARAGVSNRVRRKGAAEMLTVVFATRNRARAPCRACWTPSPGCRRRGRLEADHRRQRQHGSYRHGRAGLCGPAAASPLLHCPSPGKNRALNTALPAFEGDLIVFTDDDVLPAPDWLQRLRAAADAHPEATLFGGTVLPDWPAPLPAWLSEQVVEFSVLYAKNERASGPCRPIDIYGPNMAVRAGVFEAGTRFAEHVGPDATNPLYAMGSETELLRRLEAEGHRGWFEASAQGRPHHPARADAGKLDPGARLSLRHR